MNGQILRAGPLTMRLVDGDLRDIRLGGLEIIRRIYMVFQDQNWTARPWLVDQVDLDDGADHFTAQVQARGTFDATPLNWTATITGTDEGTITYRVTGTTTEAFLRNRLGLCVLHPITECTGQPVTIEHVDGSVEATRFPESLSPHQPFLDIRAMTHQVLPELFATVRFTGEVFETEDHRNWSDASFKTYCTPIRLPFPVTIQPGDVLEQQVSVRLEGATTTPLPTLADPIITVTGSAIPVPSIGLQIPRGTTTALTPTQVEALSALELNHLRVDIECTNSNAADHLRTAIHQAQQLRTNLWVALYATTGDQIRALLEQLPLDTAALVNRWLLFDPTSKVTPTPLVQAVRRDLDERLGRAQLISGTDLYFTELNREPLGATALALLDGICFSVNPQVHAADHQSVLQNTAGLGAIARDAPRLAGGLPLAISPLTLRPRFNPNATAPELDVSNTPLPSAVDARQRTDFAAIWALLSLKEIAEAGTIDVVTLGETIGWRGVMAEPAGSPDPANFASAPDERFPIWRALHQLAGDCKILPTVSTRPDVVQAVTLEQPDESMLLLMNVTTESHEVVVNLAGGPMTLEVPPFSIVEMRMPKGQ